MTMATKLYQKLADIQAELFVPKGQKNEFGNFNYRSCEDILKVLKPLLAKNKCAMMMSNEVKSVGSGDNALPYVEATVRLIDIEDGSVIEAKGQAREPFQKKGMDDMQITGAASSYARKYALAGLFAIDNEKDSDSQDNRGYQPKTPAGVKNETATKRCVEVWSKYKELAGPEADSQKVAENFSKLVLELTGKSKSKDVTPSEWDKVLAAFTEGGK